ncbi:hypothetical protein [Saccharopolyspora sp. NPDC002376]
MKLLQIGGGALLDGNAGDGTQVLAHHGGEVGQGQVASPYEVSGTGPQLAGARADLQGGYVQRESFTEPGEPFLGIGAVGVQRDARDARGELVARGRVLADGMS